MSEAFHTVERAAQRLELHPKTVLRFIREGRLRATRIGKSYRILASDLDALMGAPPRPQPLARVTSIVDIPDADEVMVRRITNHVMGARKAGKHAEPMSLEVAHDPVGRTLKVVIVGSPADTAELLRMVQVWVEA